MPVEYLEATVARMMCARPATPDGTPLLSLSPAWLEPLRRPPPGDGGGTGLGFMRLEVLVEQLQLHCDGEDVALVAVALNPKPEIRNPTPQTPHPKPQTPDPNPQTPDPKPGGP